jgi:NAD(P)-dependent dehydrogenase (short-subunit alcohol dehydrogenase family)
MKELDGKVALVMGATSGIGRQTTARFVAEGAHVFATGRRQDELNELAVEHGDAVTPVRNDLSQVTELDELFQAVGARGAGLDILIANAGGGSLATLEQLTLESFDETFIGYVQGTVFAVQRALPSLNAGASIVVTGSTATTRATAAFGTYSAAKAALRQFVRVWAVELGPRGVRVNTVNPGPIETAALKKQASGPGDVQRVLDAEAARVPLGRIGQPNEVAEAMVFLASDRANFITGSELFVDGGQAQA